MAAVFRGNPESSSPAASGAAIQSSAPSLTHNSPTSTLLQMMNDNQLTAFANGICCLAMVLIVGYHFVAVNGKPV
ncbi:unnamed protein product [Mortierella alpina]